MSTTVSTLLQITSTTQVDQRTSPPAAGESGDFQSHLKTATESRDPQPGDQVKPRESTDQDDSLSGDTSHDDNRSSEQLETTADANSDQTKDVKPGVEVRSDESDELELSEAIVTYLTLSGEDPSSAVIDVSQEIGVVVTEAGTGKLDSQLSEQISEFNSELAASQSGLVEGTHAAETASIAAQQVPGQAQEQADATTSDAFAELETIEHEAQAAASISAGETETSADGEQPSSSPEENQLPSQILEQAEGATLLQSQQQTGNQAEETEIEEAQPVSRLEEVEANESPIESQVAKDLKTEVESEAHVATSDPTTERNSAEPASSNTEPRVGNVQDKATSESPASQRTAEAESDPVPTGDRVRFVQRVGRAFQAARPGSNEIQLKLSPPELGTMRLSITVEQGVVSAKVETETAAARNILLDNLPALRERLAEQEIRVEKFDVDVGRDNQQNDQQSQFSSRDREANSRASSTGNLSTGDSLATEADSTTPTAQPAHVVSDDSLDVSI